MNFSLAISTILEQPINKSIQNNTFEKKRERYLDSKFYLTKSISKYDDGGKDTSIGRINKELSEFSKWDKDSIDARTKLLFKLSKEVWSVENMKADK